MSKKVYQTVLDPTKEIGRVSISSDNEEPLYYDKAGFRIPLVEQLVDYKPQYDQEISGKPWSFNFKFDVYVDVHKKIISFWFPSYWLGQLLVTLPVVSVDKFFRSRW